MKVHSHLYLAVLMVMLIFTFTFCRNEPFDQNLEPVCFESQVLPIFQTSCGISGCHGGSNPQEGFDATSYASIMKLVEPGDPLKSKVYKIITSPLNPNMMPPDNPLTKEQRTLIQAWILQGAENSTCSTK